MPIRYNSLMETPPPNRYADDLDPAMVEVLRSKSPLERIAMTDAMWRAARNQILFILRDQHPDWTEAQIQRETASRLSHGAV